VLHLLLLLYVLLLLLLAPWAAVAPAGDLVGVVCVWLAQQFGVVLLPQ
jgi:hypothetical protein